jgi:hypothetical protein
MTTSLSARSTLQRWLALVVRYWAVNMTMIHDSLPVRIEITPHANP